MTTMILTGGHVIDPAQGIDSIKEVAITDGRITEVAAHIATPGERRDVSGCYVVPGLIDIHTHVYWGGTSLSVNAEDVYARSGVTTFVDAGSSGAGNFVGFYEHVIKRAAIDIYSFLNISFAGVFAFSKRVMVGEASLLSLMSIEEAVDMCRAYPERIVGIKARACQRAAEAHGLVAIDLAIEAADQVGLPVMSHVGYPPPSLDDVVRKLRSGDIMTHAFRDAPNSFVTHDGSIHDALYAAREKGIYLDVGHGMGGFGFRVAKRLAKENIWPDMISSDIHILSVNGPAYDLLTTMSKYLNLGMPLVELIASVTSTPAKVMRTSNIGSLAPGKMADVTVMRIKKCPVEFVDGTKTTMIGDQCFEVSALYKAGKLLYTANDQCA